MQTSTLYLGRIADFPFTTIRTSPNLRCLRLWRSCLAINLIFFSSFLRQLTLFPFDNVNPRDEISSSHLFHLESLEVGWVGIDTLGPGISEDVSIAKCFSRIMKNLKLYLFYSGSGYYLSRGWDYNASGLTSP